MNVIKCLNGHFFDGDSFAVCPHCGGNPEFSGAPAGQGMGFEPPKTEKKKIGLFGKKKKQQEPFAPANEPAYTTNEGYNGYGDQQYAPVENPFNSTPAGTPATLDYWQTTPVQPTGAESTPVQQPNVEYSPVQQPEYYATPKTVYPDYNQNQQSAFPSTPVTPTTEAPPIEEAPVQETTPVVEQSAEVKAEVVEQSSAPAFAPVAEAQPAEPAFAPAVEVQPAEPAFTPVVEQPAAPVFTPAVEQPVAPVAEEAPQVEESLKDAIKKASVNPEGTTMGFFSLGNAVSSQTTSAPETDPVVGWLVCIQGRHIGESFNILSARNSIGRNDTNRIVLSKDNGVSREKHAWIVYEPKQKVFYLQPGESSGLTYLNDENIMVSKVLAPRDKIEVGESAFIFVPLCGDNFSWEDYIK